MKLSIAMTLFLMLAGCVQPQPTEEIHGTTAPPVITLLTAEPTVIQVGQSCTITCNAENPTGGELNYNWKVSLGDIVGQGSVVRYSAASCCAGVNQISVTVSNAGASASETVNVTVL